jgi:hypothetical protein
MYVMSPTDPSAPSSTPSYSCWASRIVRDGEKPRRFAASCCNVEVVNGAGGALLRSRRFTSVTTKGRPSMSVSTPAVAASSPRWNALPSMW